MALQEQVWVQTAKAWVQRAATRHWPGVTEPLCTDVVGLELAPVPPADVVALVLLTLTPGLWQVVCQFPFAVRPHLP